MGWSIGDSSMGLREKAGPTGGPSDPAIWSQQDRSTLSGTTRAVLQPFAEGDQQQPGDECPEGENLSSITRSRYQWPDI